MAVRNGKTTRRDLLVLTVLACAAYLPALGASSFWDRDEPRYAGAVQEIFRTGDWLVPRFNGEWRTDKPILVYWLMGASRAVLGENEAAFRMPSVLCTLAAAWIVFLIGRRFWSAGAGLAAGIVLLLTPLTVVMGRMATTDALLLVCTLTALWGGIRLLDEPSSHTAWMALWGGLGLAGLTKGPVAVPLVFVPLLVQAAGLRSAPRIDAGTVRGWLPCAAVLAGVAAAVAALGAPPGGVWGLAGLGAWSAAGLACALAALRAEPRRWAVPGAVVLAMAGAEVWGAMPALAPLALIALGWVRVRPETRLGRLGWGLGIPMTLAVACVWLAPLIHRTGLAFIEQSLGRHVIERSVRPLEGHSGGLWYYVVLLPFLFFPWSLLGVSGGRAVWRACGTWPIRFLLGWAGGLVVFFSCVSTKLPHYILPVMPPLALMTGWWVSQVVAGREAFDAASAGGRTLRWGLPLAVLALGSAALVGLWRAGLTAAWSFAWGLPLTGLAGAAMVARAMRGREPARVFGVLAVTTLLLCLTVTSAILPGMERYRSTKRIVRQMQRKAAGRDIILWRLREPSLVFYMRRRVCVIDYLRQLPAPDGRPLLVLTTGRFVPHLGPELKGLFEFRTLAERPFFNVARGRWEKAVLVELIPEPPAAR